MNRTVAQLARATRPLARPSHSDPLGPQHLLSTASSLLPFVPLYRRILRAHRSRLPSDLRALGDNYLRDEFRRHIKVDNPLHVVAFHSQWQMYLQTLEEQDGGVFQGRRLEHGMFDKLSEEQLYQLHEFMQAAQEAYDPNKAKGKPPGTEPPPAPQPDPSFSSGSGGSKDSKR